MYSASLQINGHFQDLIQGDNKLKSGIQYLELPDN